MSVASNDFRFSTSFSCEMWFNIDTFDQKNNFFSARKSLKLKEDDYGRNISVIMVN